MSMKKLVCLLLTAAMMFSLIACGNTNTTSNGNTTANGNAATDEGGDTATTDTIKIGVLTPLTGASAQLGNQVAEIYQMLTDIINEETSRTGWTRCARPAYRRRPTKKLPPRSRPSPTRWPRPKPA